MRPTLRIQLLGEFSLRRVRGQAGNFRFQVCHPLFPLNPALLQPPDTLRVTLEANFGRPAFRLPSIATHFKEAHQFFRRAGVDLTRP